MNTIDDAIWAAQSAAAIRACTPVYGSCALPSGHRGPHHGYRANIAAIVELAVKDALAVLLPADPNVDLVQAIVNGGLEHIARRILGSTPSRAAQIISHYLNEAAADERAACAAIAREFCQIGDSDILLEGEARRIYERILARGEVTR